MTALATPIEILAFVFSIAIILKVFIVLINEKCWANFVKAIYKNSVLLVLIEVVLAFIVYYYLIQELTIVQILAVLLLGALLTGMTLAVYGKDVVPAAIKMLRGNALKKAWLPIIVWLILAILGLYALFA